MKDMFTKMLKLVFSITLIFFGVHVMLFMLQSFHPKSMGDRIVALMYVLVTNMFVLFLLYIIWIMKKRIRGEKTKNMFIDILKLVFSIILALFGIIVTLWMLQAFMHPENIHDRIGVLMTVFMADGFILFILYVIWRKEEI